MATTTGFNGEIVWDKSKPDGTPRKLMDNDGKVLDGLLHRSQMAYA